MGQVAECWGWVASQMRQRGHRAKVYDALNVSTWITGVTATVIVASGKIDAGRFPDTMAFLRDDLRAFQSHIWWVGSSLILIAGVLSFIKRKIGEPWVWRSVARIINYYGDYFFQNVCEASAMKHHHRVTLFKRYAWWHPYCWGRCKSAHLVAVARSGHMTLGLSAAFPIADDGSQISGVSGKAYAERRTVGPIRLADVGPATGTKNLKKYAEQSYVTFEYVKARVNLPGRKMPRTLLSFPVVVDGNIWGVVVLDSVSPTALESIDDRVYDVMSKTLGRLLERG